MVRPPKSRRLRATLASRRDRLVSVREFSFRDQLVMSTGVAAGAAVDEILISAIPGAVGVRRAAAHEDRNGTDWWVDQFNGDPLSIDLKARAEDFARRGKDDLALEVWSVVETRVPGWTRDSRKRTDYVLWWWQDTGRWCLVPFPMLCAVFVEHLDEWTTGYQVADQRTDGRYSSRCVYVPRVVVWRAIYDRYGGAPLQGAA
jgi:hypothetical protein